MKSSVLLLPLFFSVLLPADILTFSKAYNLALDNSHTIKSSQLMQKSEMQKIKEEESALYPHLNLSSSYKKAEYYTESNVNKQTVKSYTVSLKQSVYNAETYARVDMQKQRTKYAALDIKQKKIKVAQDVCTTYFDIIKSAARIALLESQKAYNKSMLKKIEKQYNMNLSDKVDFLEMKVEYSSIKIDLNKEKKRYLTYKEKLKNYTAEEEIYPAKIDLERDFRALFYDMSRVTKNKIDSLDIAQAQTLLEMKGYALKQAKAAYYPKIDIDMAYSKYYMDSPTIQDPYTKTQYGIVSLTMPIYSGGYISSALEESRLTKQAAYEDFMQAREDADLKYSNAFSIFNASMHSVTLYQEAYKAAKSYVAGMQKKYEKGVVNVVEYNKAKQKLYNIQYQFVNNIYDMLQSYIQILIETNNLENIGLLDKFLKDANE